MASFLLFRSQARFAHTFPSRENVEPLIRHFSNARYKGFSTQDKAKEFYLDSKKMNKIRIVRDPGDDEKYGSMDNAVQ